MADRSERQLTQNDENPVRRPSNSKQGQLKESLSFAFVIFAFYLRPLHCCLNQARSSDVLTRL